MFTITDLCLLCLSNKANLKSILTRDSDGVNFEEKLKYFIHKHIEIQSEVSMFVCLPCSVILNYVYNYKRLCLTNITTFNSFIYKLKSTGKPYGHLQVKLNDFNDVICENKRKRDSTTTENYKVDSVTVQTDPNKDEAGIIGEYRHKQEIIGKTLEKETSEMGYLHIFDNAESNNVPEENIIAEVSNILDDEIKCELTDEIVKEELEDFYDIIDTKSELHNDKFSNETDSNEGYVHDDEYLPLEDDLAVGKIVENKIDNVDLSFSDSSEKYKEKSVSQELNSDSQCEISVLFNQKMKGKKQACFYCEKLLINLPRHFELKHRGETEVIKIMSLKKKDPERFEILDSLRKQGNFIYNSKILTTGGGNIVVKKRPGNVNKNAFEYLPCSTCLGFYKKKSLYRHMKHCVKEKQKYSRIQGPASLLLPISKHASTTLKERVLSIMRVDTITNVIKKDTLLLQYGSYLCEKYSREDEKQMNLQVSSKLREMGRLLIEVRNIDTNLDRLQTLINPTNFDTIIQATKNAAGYDISTGKCNTATLPNKIGLSLIKCAEILKAIAIRTQNNVLKQIVDDYVLLHKKEWNTKINETVKHTLNNNEDQILVLANDIRKITTYLNKRQEELIKQLTKTFTYPKYLELNEVIMTHIVLFNRNQVGDVQRVQVKNFDCRNNVNTKYQSSVCQIETRGKTGQKKLLIMSKATENTIIFLMKLRQKSSIPIANPYLFATRRKYGVINATNAFRKMTSKCLLSNPESLRSTNLRKHVASMSQILSLGQSEMSILATFVGHDPVVHREFYKVPDSSVHLVKLSNLLLTIRSGDANKHNNLCNLNLDHNEDLDSLDFIIADNKFTSARRSVRKSNDSILPEIKVSDSFEFASSTEEFNKSMETNDTYLLLQPEMKNPIKFNTRKPWSQAEVNAIKKHLSQYMAIGKSSWSRKM